MKNLKQHLQQTGHKLVTRRDFLAHGLITFSAAVTLPRFLSLKKAWAEGECGGGALPSLPPFMVYDMAGGAALPASFLVGGEGGPEDLLPSYNLLGWDPRESGALNKDFGIPMSALYSTFLTSMIANSSPEARSRLRMGSLCHFAQDDTSTNRMNAGNLALRAGLRGMFISNGLGNMNTLSGGNSSPVSASPSLKPIFASSVDSVLGATNFGGEALRQVGIEKLQALAESSVELSRLQKEDYRSQPDGEVLADLSQCAYEQSLTFVNGVEGLDPRLDGSTQAVYGIDQNSAASDMNVVAAAITMNSIKGHSGPSVWTLGGCDYHDGSQETGDRQDGLMGAEIGRAIELAHRLQRPFFFQLLTDGSCSANPGTREWQSDSGDKCMTILGYYDPKGPPKMLRQQVGYYTSGQGAERETLIGSEPSLVGYAVLANYLNICGKLKDFNSIAPGVFTDPRQLESVLLFEGPA